MYIPVKGSLQTVACIFRSHFSRNIEQSRPHRAGSIHQRIAWLYLKYWTPSCTNVLSRFVAWYAAKSESWVRSTGMELWKTGAISNGAQVRILHLWDTLKHFRIYARLSKALDVNGNGPLGSKGSRLDSGVCCQKSVHFWSADLLEKSERSFQGIDQETQYDRGGLYSRTDWKSVDKVCDKEPDMDLRLHSILFKRPCITT